MRVLVNRRHDERGAIAIMMAFCMVMLCVFGALVVDFGQAYVVKNNAQETADASALAAGKVYMVGKAHCVNGLVIGGSLAQAQTAADTIRTQSMQGSTGTLNVHCDPDGSLKVGYDVTANSPLGLGALVAGTDHMTVARHAAVKFGTAQEGVGNLRPWMICGTQVPDGPYPSTKVVEVGFPANGHNHPKGGCTPNKPGSWWKTTCFNGGGSHGDSYQNVLVGCDTVTLAPTTPGNPNPYAELTKDCNPSYPGTGTPNKNGWIESTSCLADDTGRDVKGLEPAWATLLGKTVAMPVFCDTPQCNPSSVVSDTKGTWPVWKIAAVTVCGFALKGVYSSSTLPTGDCNNMNTGGADPRDFDKADIGFLLIFKGLIEPGGASTFPVQTNATLRLVE